MPTEFDQIRALKEEIAGLAEIRATIIKRSRELEQRYGELEVELNVVKKLQGFADVELARKRSILNRLENGG